MGTNGLSDTGCIICRELVGCQNGRLGLLDMDDMICFCKTDKCNQCEYRRTTCKQIDVKTPSFVFGMKMEVCQEVDMLCSNELGTSTTMNIPSNSETKLITKNDSDAGATTISNADQSSITTPLTLLLISISIATI